MLNEHPLDQLRGLRADGMLHAIEEQATSIAASALVSAEAELNRSSARAAFPWIFK